MRRHTCLSIAVICCGALAALLSCDAQLVPNHNSQNVQHFIVAPPCCLGCSYGESTCCCPKRLPTTKITVRRSFTYTAFRTTATSTVKTASTKTITVNAMGYALPAKAVKHPKVAAARDAGDVVPLGLPTFEEPIETSAAPADHQLFARHLCPSCPSGVKLSSGKNNNGNNQYCCHYRTATVIATKKITKTQFTRATRTIYTSTTTLTKKQIPASVSGQLFQDSNGNTVFEYSLDTAVSNAQISAVQTGGGGIRKTSQERSSSILMSNVTDSKGNFKLSGFFPPSAKVDILDSAGNHYGYVQTDSWGQPTSEKVSLIKFPFKCASNPVPGMSSTDILSDADKRARLAVPANLALTAAIQQWTNKTLKFPATAQSRCQYPDYGWRKQILGACEMKSNYAGLVSSKLQIEMVANQTRCLVGFQVATRNTIGSFIHSFGPKVSISSTESPSPTKYKTAPEFSESSTLDCTAGGYTKVNSSGRSSLTDASHTLLATAYANLGGPTVCGTLPPSGSAIRYITKILAACSKSSTTSKNGQSVSGGAYLLKMYADVSCTARKANWTALVSGSVQTYESIIQIYKHDRKNLTAPFNYSWGKYHTPVPLQRRDLRLGRSGINSKNIRAPLMSPRDHKLGKRESNKDCQNGMCLYDFKTLNSFVTNYSSILTIPIPGFEQVLSWFDPEKFVTAEAGQTICNMTFQGSDLASAATATGALSWFSTVQVPGISDAVSWFDMILGLPVNPDEYYVIGFYTTTVPGVEYPPDFPSIQIASAMNPCVGDFLFSFAGVQMELLYPDPPTNITVALDAMGISVYGDISMDDLQLVTSYWSPSGQQTVDFSGQTYIQGSISFDLGDVDTDPVVVSVTAMGTMLINVDPSGDGGAGNGDIAMALDISAAPTLILLNGALQLDLSSMASANLAMAFQYFSSTNYTVALQATFTVDLAGFFACIPVIGNAIQAALEPMFSGFNMNGEFDLWLNQDSWGMNLCMSGGGMLSVLGDTWTLLTDFIPTLPSGVDACFSISGAMTGNGLPVKSTFTFDGTAFSMYFCSADSQCPSGFTCNSGLCSTITCPSNAPVMNGLLCYSGCAEGYTLVAGVCWQNCESGYVDTGAFCSYPAGECPPGTVLNGLLCYPPCESGYTNVAGVCWQNCDPGFTDEGALCMQPAYSYGKGCCCIEVLVCHGWSCGWEPQCCNNCDSGFEDTGCTCFRPAYTYAKNSYIVDPITTTYAKLTYDVAAYPLVVIVAGLVF